MKFGLKELQQRLENENDQFVEFFKHGDLHLELYAPNMVDRQSPHERDEIYIILSGSGIFQHENHQEPFGPGDVLFVPAGDEHRFVQFDEDFRTWVIFYGPQGGHTQKPNEPH